MTAADRLIDEANDAGGRDNITVILFNLEESAAATRRAADAGGGGGPVGERGRHGAADEGLRSGRQSPVRHGGAALASTAARLADQRRSGARAWRAPRAAAPTAPQRHLGRLGKLVIALISTSIVLFMFGGGGYLASRQLYFLGTNSQGMVTVYRGLPVCAAVRGPAVRDVLRLGRARLAVPADRRATLLNHDLRSQSRRHEPDQRHRARPGRADESAQPGARGPDPGVAAADGGLRGGVHPAIEPDPDGHPHATAWSSSACASPAHIFIRITLPHADPYIFPLVAVLACFGLVMVYRITALARPPPGAVVRVRPDPVRLRPCWRSATTASSRTTDT